MPCYFMNGHRIEAVAILNAGSDADLIREATALFEEEALELYDGFEVWEINRFVYRWPPKAAGPPDGKDVA